MSKRRRGQSSEDHTSVAFLTATIFACAIVAVVEDVLYFATGVPFWSTWRFHPISIFAGALAFSGLLYLLQRMHDRARALQYLQPYTPLVALSGANVALKLNPAWLLPVVIGCVAWSVARVRKLRGRKLMARGISALK